MAEINLEGIGGFLAPRPVKKPVPAPGAEPIVAPYTIVIDTREQRPWDFDGISQAVGEELRPVQIATEVRVLQSADYSLAGHETAFALERKSLQDLFNTIIRGRGRFENELARLQNCDVSAVIVEREWKPCLKYCQSETKFHPEAFTNTIIAWRQRYPKTQWFFCDGRSDAIDTAWRMMERFYKDRQHD